MYTNLRIKKLTDTNVEISAAVPFADIEPYRKRALKHLAKTTKLPGFRPGHVPEKIIIERVGEQGVLTEAAEHVLKDVYPMILRDKDIRAVGHPHVTITKLAAGNPFEFTIETATMPAFSLPDYVKIAQEEMSKKETIDVTDKDVDDVIADIQKTRMKASQKKSDEKVQETKAEETPPPLTDEFVKTLGHFTNVADFKDHIKKNLLKEKEMLAKEKKRLAISDILIQKTKLTLPRILIDSELNKMMAQFQSDISRMGVSFDDYLKKIKKTEADLRKEWEETATKRAKLQVLLDAIAEKEKLVPDAKDMNTHVEHLKKQYGTADPERIRIYVETILTNEKVFAFLESQTSA